MLELKSAPGSSIEMQFSETLARAVTRRKATLNSLGITQVFAEPSKQSPSGKFEVYVPLGSTSVAGQEAVSTVMSGIAEECGGSPVRAYRSSGRGSYLTFSFNGQS